MFSAMPDPLRHARSLAALAEAHAAAGDPAAAAAARARSLTIFTDLGAPEARQLRSSGRVDLLATGGGGG
jgi:hypothetical protein